MRTYVKNFLDDADDIMVNRGGDEELVEELALAYADDFCGTDAKVLFDACVDYSGMALNISSDEICEILKSHIADALTEIYNRA